MILRLQQNCLVRSILRLIGLKAAAKKAALREAFKDLPDNLRYSKNIKALNKRLGLDPTDLDAADHADLAKWAHKRLLPEHGQADSFYRTKDEKGNWRWNANVTKEQQADGRTTYSKGKYLSGWDRDKTADFYHKVISHITDHWPHEHIPQGREVAGFSEKDLEAAREKRMAQPYDGPAKEQISEIYNKFPAEFKQLSEKVLQVRKKRTRGKVLVQKVRGSRKNLQITK